MEPERASADGEEQVRLSLVGTTGAKDSGTLRIAAGGFFVGGPLVVGFLFFSGVIKEPGMALLLVLVGTLIGVGLRIEAAIVDLYGRPSNRS